jgi:hypothetical protein
MVYGQNHSMLACNSLACIYICNDTCTTSRLLLCIRKCRCYSLDTNCRCCRLSSSFSHEYNKTQQAKSSWSSTLQRVQWKNPPLTAACQSKLTAATASPSRWCLAMHAQATAHRAVHVMLGSIPASWLALQQAAAALAIQHGQSDHLKQP